MARLKLVEEKPFSFNSFQTVERKKEEIEKIKDKIQESFPHIEQKNYSFSVLPGVGIPKSGICEFFGVKGCGKTEIVLRFLSEHQDLNVIWIESKWSIYPRCFNRFGVELSRVLFVEAQDSYLWGAMQSIRSGLFPVVVMNGCSFSSVELRRLQLQSQRNGISLICIQEKKTQQGAWPLSLQVEVLPPEIEQYSLDFLTGSAWIEPRLKVMRHRRGVFLEKNRRCVESISDVG